MRVTNEKKNNTRELLRSKLGILVSKPKPGFGSTNDGNTARTFFKNIDIVSQITGMQYSFLIHAKCKICVFMKM